jgi:hypothetical protein
MKKTGLAGMVVAWPDLSAHIKAAVRVRIGAAESSADRAATGA